MDSAYKKFFKEHTGYPRFKTKKTHRVSYQSKCVNGNIQYYGKYDVSLCCTDVDRKSLEKTDNKVGIDLGIKDLVVTSNGEKIDNLKHITKYEDKLTREQRKIAHKQKGSKNREKQRIKVAKIHEKIANIRNDYLHKISHSGAEHDRDINAAINILYEGLKQIA